MTRQCNVIKFSFLKPQVPLLQQNKIIQCQILKSSGLENCQEFYLWTPVRDLIPCSWSSLLRLNEKVTSNSKNSYLQHCYWPSSDYHRTIWIVGQNHFLRLSILTWKVRCIISITSKCGFVHYDKNFRKKNTKQQVLCTKVLW